MTLMSASNDNSTLALELAHFLANWDQRYQDSVSKIPLFNSALTSQWSPKQKELLVGYLYHQRGHFHDLLWEMGNNAPTSELKEMIIDNIRDEFGGRGISHEAAYYLFANHFGVDLSRELVENKYYSEFLRKYQHDILAWVKKRPWNKKISAFAAIERLDNIDYANLLGLARSLDQLTSKEEAFFVIHINVAHFSSKMKDELSLIWANDNAAVEEGFTMVLDLYTSIWQSLYDHISMM